MLYLPFAASNRGGPRAGTFSGSQDEGVWSQFRLCFVSGDPRFLGVPKPPTQKAGVNYEK